MLEADDAQLPRCSHDEVSAVGGHLGDEVGACDHMPDRAQLASQTPPHRLRQHLHVVGLGGGELLAHTGDGLLGLGAGLRLGGLLDPEGCCGNSSLGSAWCSGACRRLLPAHRGLLRRTAAVGGLGRRLCVGRGGGGARRLCGARRAGASASPARRRAGLLDAGRLPDHDGDLAGAPDAHGRVPLQARKTKLGTNKNVPMRLEALVQRRLQRPRELAPMNALALSLAVLALLYDPLEEHSNGFLHRPPVLDRQVCPRG
mmetsp:Transcript_158670/g.485749  ORF Transcript_158670/g.485749 Transcript_158670/m.485749 type:complete len:258 (-) Transcript_158670:15-788(-)